MTAFEEKSNKVLNFVNAHFQEDNPFLEKKVTLSDVSKLLKSVIVTPLYYCNIHSNNIEKSKYKLHTDYIDLLTQLMSLIVGEFSITFTADRTDKDSPAIEEAMQEIYNKYPHTAPIQREIKIHTIVKTEIDGFFYDEQYGKGEILNCFISPACYSQIAFVKFILRYAGFFESLGIFDRVLAAVKVVLTTPMIFEDSCDESVKEQIEKFFGLFVTDEVRKKYEEERKEKEPDNTEKCKFNFNLYQIVVNREANGLPFTPVLVAATDMHDAYNTFVKSYIEAEADPKSVIDGVVKVSENLAFSDDVYELVEKKIINKPIEHVNLRGPFSFLYDMETINLNKEEQ